MAATNFFLGANSGDGFQNLFGEIAELESTHDLMILKGGPGAGKSTFLKEIGRAMEAAGTPVEYLWCSGDPTSLDGVTLPELRCAAVDGTPPHVVEPQYPAAIDRCVDLGRFYDLTAAKSARTEIIARTREYRAAYVRACHSLRAARQVELDAVNEMQRGMDWRRAARRVSGIIGREFRRRGREEGRCTRRFLGGFTCQGPVWRFDTVDTLCPKVYELADSWELSGRLLQSLAREAGRTGWNTIACLAPEEPERMEHLLVPGLGLAFVTSGPGMKYSGGRPYRRIRLDAMIGQTENRARVKFETRMAGILREEAVAALAEAREAHDALEAIYNPYVDFDGVRAQAALEISRLLSWLERVRAAPAAGI